MTLAPAGLAFTVSFVLAVTPAESQTCQLEPIVAGGNFFATGTIKLPLEAVRHALRNAVLAAGGEIQIDQEARLEAVREPSRIAALRLQKGPEALFVKFEPHGSGNEQTVDVTVETKRANGKDGVPRLKWSEAILAQAICLSELLSPVDPKRIPRGPESLRPGPLVERPVQLKAGTKVILQLRNFTYSSEVRPGKNLVLEAAKSVEVDGLVAIRGGALANAHFTQIQDARSFGRGANISVEVDWVTAADGKRVNLTATPFTARGAKASVLLGTAALGIWGAIGTAGSDAALLAGERLEATVKTDEEIFVQGPPTAEKDPSRE